MMNRTGRRDELRNLGRSSFAGYCSLIRRSYKVYKHLARVNALVEDMAKGLVTRAIIAMPPRHGKSYTFSELGPAYMNGLNPGMKMLQGAYGADLAEDFGRAVRDQMQSPLYRQIFGFGLSPSVKAAGHFRTIADGSYLAGGINSPFTGFGANWFNIDDPIKTRKEAESETYRKQIINWLQGVVYDRLEDFDDGRESILTVCATRWHPEDLSGYLMKELRAEGFLYIALPAIVDQFGQRCNPDDPGAIPLFPEKFSLERYAARKIAVGSYEWEAKYQQNPTPLSGGIINVEWFNHFRSPPRVAYKVQSWDTAQKDKLTSAYSTCGDFHTVRGRHYLERVFREKLQYPALRRAVISNAERFQPDEIMIEDKASGISLIQDLRKETSLPIIAVEPDADKITRAFAQSALVEAGLCYLLEGAGWVADFESEIRGFPGGTYADQIDMFTQYLKRHRNRKDGFAFARTGARDSASVDVTAGGGFGRTG